MKPSFVLSTAVVDLRVPALGRGDLGPNEHHLLDPIELVIQPLVDVRALR